MNTIRFPGDLIDSLMVDNKIEVKPFKFFIFNEFVLKVEGFKNAYGESADLTYKVAYNNDFCNCPEEEEIAGKKYLNYGGEWWLIKYALSYDNVYFGEYYVTGIIGKYDKGDLNCLSLNRMPSFTEDCIDLEWEFLRLLQFCMGYIMNYPRDRKQAKAISHKYSREHRISTRQNKLYLFSDILKYVSDNYVPEGGHHNIQCPCWEVRGHYRHYKSGKVVFIPAYKKGKQRDKVEPRPKEYYA